jgi:hypothetical protein
MNTPEIKLSIGYLAAEELPKQEIDQELNIESENAIANKAVATAINELNEKVDNIEIPDVSIYALKTEIPDVSDCVKNGVLESAVNDINASLNLKANASDLENLATKSEIPDAYTKAEIDEMFGTYVDEVNTLLGGE